MNESRAPIARAGVDLAKQVIQVHAVDASGRRVVARAFKRDQFFAWCAQLPAGCLVAMEACSSAHYWGRKLRTLGLDARLIAANFVTPYRMEGQSGKNDATDAAAICEAASRPSMRFVPIKTCEQQGVMSLHRVRESLKEERTACINQIRGVLTEFGLAFGRSPKVLRSVLTDVIEDASNELSPTARLVMQRAFEHWRELDEHMHWCDRQIGQHVRSSSAAKRAAKIIGIGELCASAFTAGVGDFKQFKSGHQFGAWLGIVPRQDTSGGKIRLGRITKRGDDYLRTVLIQGAKAAVMTADKRDDPNSRWLAQLTARVGWQKACVAMANKNARILWAVMTREEGFDPNHVSVKPQAKQTGLQHAPEPPGAACTT
ncbi:IS110 family transposase [Ralstonia sp.]|uniref:IS110 family transposase n=1 Tax=Ralstonia sp. TaxID=54061 RepID=UPI00257C2831|nr:IS110 family transposase [Ralstonia sp.]MBA4282348.1 IS110 family transposase [Ralstonia sp.]